MIISIYQNVIVAIEFPNRPIIFMPFHYRDTRSTLSECDPICASWLSLLRLALFSFSYD